MTSLPMLHGGRRMAVRDLLVSAEGQPFYTLRWEMPRIHDQVLDCVFYLYRSVQEARDSEHAGGTGFLVAVPDSLNAQAPHHIYAVTAWHVIWKGAPVIRLNIQAGTHALPLTRDHWTRHDDDDEIAVSYLGRGGA